MIVSVLFALLSFPVLRAYAGRVERSDREDVEKVHRLRRVSLVQLGVAFVLGIAAAVETVVERSLLDLGWLRPAGRVIFFVAVLGGIVIGQIAIRPAYQRLRGIDSARAKAARSPGRTARSLVLVVPMLVWFGVFFALKAADAPTWTLLAAVVGFLVTIAIVSPLLVRLAVPTTPPDARVRDLVSGICERAWVQIGDIRVMDTQVNPMANAMFSGFGPGPTYVFLTDVLIEELDDRQLEAVVAHEVGHLKGHHIAQRQGTLLAGLVVLFGSQLLAAYGRDHGMPTALATTVLLVGLLAGLLTTFVLVGLVAIRNEKKADDFAASLVGRETLVSALERLAEVNMMERRTGRVWNLLTKHPGFEQRIERLRDVGASSGPASVSPPTRA